MSYFQHERFQTAAKHHLCDGNHLIRPDEIYVVGVVLPGSSMDYQSGDVHDWDFTWGKLCMHCYDSFMGGDDHRPADVRFPSPAFRKAFVKMLSGGHMPEPDPPGISMDAITEHYSTLMADRFTCFRHGCQRAIVSAGRAGVWGSMLDVPKCTGTGQRQRGMYAPKEGAS